MSADVNATVNKNPAITIRDNNKDLFLMLLNDIFSTPYLGPQCSKPFWIQTGNNNIYLVDMEISMDGIFDATDGMIR